MPTITLPSGDLYYEAAGQGPPLLLLHGFTDSGRDLERVAAPLRRDWRVILPDMPGYGQSAPRSYTPDFYAQDAATMWALLDALGVPAAHLGGFSDGSEVALLMAIQRPTAARAVVAWGIAGALDASALPEVAEIGALMDAPPPHRVSWRDTLLARYGAERARAMTQGWATATRALIAGGGDVSLSRAHTVQCPVLIINGADDAVNPPAAVAALAARLPHCETIIVPATDHAVHDLHSAWFNQTIGDWLARVR
ncbi:MAG: alpha/beta hydrolase [Chloroflexota bacterium]|nr:alpha/beta hydrolase [Chloroflexota bacterium]